MQHQPCFSWMRNCPVPWPPVCTDISPRGSHLANEWAGKWKQCGGKVWFRVAFKILSVQISLNWRNLVCLLLVHWLCSYQSWEGFLSELLHSQCWIFFDEQFRFAVTSPNSSSFPYLNQNFRVGWKGKDIYVQDVQIRRGVGEEREPSPSSLSWCLHAFFCFPLCGLN